MILQIILDHPRTAVLDTLKGKLGHGPMASKKEELGPVAMAQALCSPAESWQPMADGRGDIH